MKRLPLVITIAALSGMATTSFAQEGTRRALEGNARTGEFRERLLKQFDADGDGRLNDAEQAKAKAAAAKMRGIAEGPGRMDKAQLLKQFDKDGDGKLTEEERQAAMKAREEMAKRAGDAAGRPGPGMIGREELMKKFDKNGDGKLDESEQAAAREAAAKFRGQRGAGAAPGNAEPREPRVDKKELLEKFDADGDGKLNDKERTKAVEEFKNRKKA